MKNTQSHKKKWFLMAIFIFAMLVFIAYMFRGYIGYTIYLVLKPVLEAPREISLSHNLPGSATDIHEKTYYLQPPPDEEYRYYLKAKINKEEFLEFAEDLSLEWASPINRSWIPNRNPEIPWWNPPSTVFLYATGNKMDYCMQADYIESTGYVYLYIEQN